MADPFEVLGALRDYIQVHEKRREEANKKRPGRTKSTVATKLYDPALETDEQRMQRERAEFDANFGDVNRALILQANLIGWINGRVGVLEVNHSRQEGRIDNLHKRQSERPNRRELWMVFVGLMLVGLLTGVTFGAVGASVVWSIWFDEAVVAAPSGEG